MQGSGALRRESVNASPERGAERRNSDTASDHKLTSGRRARGEEPCRARHCGSEPADLW